MADTIPISQLTQLNVNQITSSAIFPISNISDNTTYKVLVGDLDTYIKTSTSSVQTFGGTSKYALTASYATSSATSSFLKYPNVSSASYAVTSISSSYSVSSSFSTNAISAGYANVANVLLNPFTATLVPSSSATLFLQYNPANPNNGTASYSVLSQNSVTSSYVNGANIFASSSGFANSASWSPRQLPNVTSTASYVGILQPNPIYTLDVNGSIGNSSTGNGILFTLDSGGNTILQNPNAHGSWHLNNIGLFYFILSGVNQYRFGGAGSNSYVGGSGNGDFFGVNTGLPQYTLDVAGDINFSGNLFSGSGQYIPHSSSYSPKQLPDITDIIGSHYIGIGQTNPQYSLDVNGKIGNSNGNVVIVSSNGLMVGNTTGSSINIDSGYGYNSGDSNTFNGATIQIQGGDGTNTGNSGNIILMPGNNNFGQAFVGVNQLNPEYTLDVNGSIGNTSGNITLDNGGKSIFLGDILGNTNSTILTIGNQLYTFANGTISGSKVIATSFTASNGFYGTASYSSFTANASTASYVNTASYSNKSTSGSFATTAANLSNPTAKTNGNGLQIMDVAGSTLGIEGGGLTMLWNSSSNVSPFSISNALTDQQFFAINGSGSIVTQGYISASYISASILYGTASYSSYANSSSYAVTASYVSGSNNSVSSSYATFAFSALTASYSVSASNVVVNSYTVSSSYATSSLSSSYTLSASYANTASYVATSGSVLLSRADGTTILYSPISNTNTSRGDVLLSASAAATNLDTIIVSNNVYDIGFNQIDLSLGGNSSVNLQGKGKLSTKIISSWFGYMVMPGLNSEISNLTLQTTNHSYPSPCIGINSGTISGSTIRNVKLIGLTDGIYINNSCTVLGTINVYDTDIYTNWDTIVWTPASGKGTFNAYNCNCFVVPTGSVSVAGPSDGFVAESGNTASLFNCSFNIIGSGSGATANGIFIDAAYGGPSVSVYGCVISTSGSSAYDFSHTSGFGSQMGTTTNTIYNPTKVTGPLNYLDTNQILKSINNSVATSVSASYAVTASYVSGSSNSSVSSSYSQTSISSSYFTGSIISGSLINLTCVQQIDPLEIASATNGYTEINIQNTSGSVSASSDLVATNNLGSTNAYYIDVGINASNYSQGFVGFGNDAYVYNTGSNLYIGSITPNTNLYLFAGGYINTSSVVLTSTGKFGIGLINPVNSLDVAGNISCSAITASTITSSRIVCVNITGSLYGTSSYAITSSTAATAVTASYAITSSTAATSSFSRLFNPSTNSWYAIQISGSVGQETLLFTPTT